MKGLWMRYNKLSYKQLCPWGRLVTREAFSSPHYPRDYYRRSFLSIMYHQSLTFTAGLAILPRISITFNSWWPLWMIGRVYYVESSLPVLKAPPWTSFINFPFILFMVLLSFAIILWPTMNAIPDLIGGSIIYSILGRASRNHCISLFIDLWLRWWN